MHRLALLTALLVVLALFSGACCVEPPTYEMVLERTDGTLDAFSATQSDAARVAPFREPLPGYDAWTNGPPTDPDFFPIAVWLQPPELAPQYRELGINTYIGLWQGPTEAQLATLRRHGMKVICERNAVALRHLDDPTIIAWMHGDEPDNRQADGGPVPLWKIWDDYRTMVNADPTRPVFMNLGQGVANEKFGGRALEYEQYAEYLRGCDIASYDVYPIANYKDTGPDGKTVLRDDGDEMMWIVARGVRRLRAWTDYRKPVWNVIECTNIHNPERRATPEQVRAMVWMSIIHGSQGICWFVHQWQPTKNVAQLLADPEMREAVKRVNHEVLELAPVLNSRQRPRPGVTFSALCDSDFVLPEGRASFPAYSSVVHHMTRRTGDALYVFTVNMTDEPADACLWLSINEPSADDAGEVTIKGRGFTGPATVLGEGRTVEFADGQARDDFAPHAVHLYRIEL